MPLILIPKTSVQRAPDAAPLPPPQSALEVGAFDKRGRRSCLAPSQHTNR